MKTRNPIHAFTAKPTAMKARLLSNKLPSIHFSNSFSPRLLGAASACTLLVSSVASAAIQYWDPGLTPTANIGKGSGGSGTWLTATANWSNGTADAALAVTDTATFGVTTTAAVALTTPVTTAGMVFESNGYVIGNATALSQVFASSQVTDTSGIVVGSGVTGTTIDVGSVKLGSAASATSIWLSNTDLVDFKNTAIILTGSRTTKITNSSASTTTTFARFATSDKSAGGTWPNAQVQLIQGNLTINSLAAGSSVVTGTNGAVGTFGGNAATATFPTVFNGATTGTLTINGDNTLYTNAIAGQGPVIFNFNMATGTLVLGHDNALGARTATSVLTNNTLQVNSGTVTGSAARNIENRLIVAGNFILGGANDFTFTQDVTNSGGSRTLTVSNTATTLSGSVYLANDDNTARTFSIAGNTNTTISGAIANNKFGGSLSSNLTKSGNSTLTVSNANSYSGTTTVTAGILKIGNTQSLGNNGLTKTAVTGGTTISAGGTLDLNGQTGINEVLTLNGTGDGVNGALTNSSATAASIAGGVVSSLGLTGTATGLSAPPTVAISGGGGSGATAVASLGLTLASIGTPVIAGGTYSAAPAVAITGGGGSGATATVTTAGVLTLTNAGSGYTSAPTVTFLGGTTSPTTGVTMTATANATNFALVGIALTASGSGYTSAPAVSLSTDPSTAATANLVSVALASDTSVGGTGDITINPPVSGGFALTKVGANTVTLAGASNYTGATNVSAGKLNVSGSITSAVTVNTTGTLYGTGGITGNVQVTSGGHFASAIAATTGGQVPLAITGTLTVDSGNILDLTAVAAPAAGVYKLATTTGGVTYTAGTVNVTGVAGTVSISGNDLVLTVAAGSGYSGWAATNAGGQTANLDFDNDGTTNGVEYFMNAPAGFTANPSLVGGTVTWANGGNIPSSDYGTQFVVQKSSDLVNWTDVPSGSVTNTSGFVSYTPTGPGSSFARLFVKPN